MNTRTTLKQRLIDAVTMTLVSALSLMVVLYVGYGEALRSYQKFQVEKLDAQGRLVQTAMGSYLHAGLPLRQYVGFGNRAEAILASDSTITAMAVFDVNGEPVFHVGQESVPLLARTSTGIETEDDALDLRANDTYLQIVLPLRNKFETVGSLALTTPRSLVARHLEGRFRNLFVVAMLLSIAFGWFVSIMGSRLGKSQVPWQQIVYALVFLAMSVMVVGTLMGIYSEGAQIKTKALADTLGQRIHDIVAFNLNFDEIVGLDKAFGEYRRLNPDISAAALIVNDKVLIDTDESAIGRPWVSNSGTYEYVIDLTRPEPNANKVHVAVALPARIVYSQVARSVKNVAALFVASAFFAGLFLQLAQSVRQHQLAREDGGFGCARTICAPASDDTGLSLVKPVFFLAVFLENLTYSFLPQFMEGVVLKSGLSPGFASAPFMIYYLLFALTLVPAGHYAQRVGPRMLISVGLLLAATGLVVLTFPIDFTLAMVARALSGIGQGMLFIGVQCYILAKSRPGQKTQGASIIVFGFQGGMISGMAIGSLLVIDMGMNGVFALAALIAVTMAIYVIFLVPRVPVNDDTSTDFRRLWSDIRQALGDSDFLSTMTLIGVPAKAVMTGIIIFALPLILARNDYAQEDIGQVIMLYAAGVLLAGRYVSRLVDRTGKTNSILCWGAVISGVGLILVGLSGLDRLAELPNSHLLINLLLIVGVVMVGVAHGFVNAPVVTHIADSRLAGRIGANSATAIYRFLERIGHAAGPILVGQLLLVGGQSPAAMSWAGAAIILFGIIFFIRTEPGPTNPAVQEIEP